MKKDTIWILALVGVAALIWLDNLKLIPSPEDLLIPSPHDISYGIGIPEIELIPYQ